jgi:hypothetical protein
MLVRESCQDPGFAFKRLDRFRPRLTSEGINHFSDGAKPIPEAKVFR